MKTINLLPLLLCFWGSVLVAQQPGSLDAAFGNAGIVTTNVVGGNSNDLAYSIAQQPDGKLLVAGFTTVSSNFDFALVRYLSDGSLDSSFGNGGVVTTDFGGGGDRASKLLLQPDGKIVLTGYTSAGNSSNFTAARYLPDGALDPSFGDGGKVISDLGGYEYPNSAALQPDGKIVVAGVTYPGGAGDFALLRYNEDGTLDTGFGTNGIVITEILDDDQAFDVAIQPDGKIVAAGYAANASLVDFALIRYNPDGTFDKSFGTEGNGLTLTDMAGNNAPDIGKSLAILPDGSILLAGLANYSNISQTAEVGLAKYDSNGMPDASFGTDGVVIESIGSKCDLLAVQLQGDGKILVAGKSDIANNQNRWMLARFLPDGAFDNSFGNSGVVSTDMTGSLEVALDIVLQADNKIVVAGRVGDSQTSDFGLARYFGGLSVAVAVQNTSCFGSADGTITVEAIGGLAPYQYSLDGVDFQASNIFSNLPAGGYTIYVVDASGAPGNIAATILEPSPPAVAIDVVDNNLTITVAGGIGGFQYSVDGGTTFQANNVFSNLPNGTYHLVVKDANGCTVFDDQLLIDFTAVHERGLLALRLFPNPSDGMFFLEMENADARNLAIKVTDLTGKQVYSAVLNGGQPLRRQLDFRFLAQGCYQLKVWDGNDWAAKKMVVVK